MMLNIQRVSTKKEMTMSMHKSFRTDVQHSAGQVVYQPKALEQEIEEYKQALRACRCNDECVNLCEQCPNRVQENTNCR
jgi:hypothetical protein